MHAKQRWSEILGVALALAMGACVDTRDESGSSETSANAAAVPKATESTGPSIDCRNGMDPTIGSFQPQPITPPDDRYRAPPSEKARLKEQAARGALRPNVAVTPPSPELIKRQGQYLSELKSLRAKHERNPAAFERERMALKERVLGN